MKRISILLWFCVNSALAGTMGSSSSGLGGLYAGLGTGFTNIVTDTSYINSYSQFGGYFDTSSNSRYNNTAIIFTGQLGYGKMLQPRTYVGAKASVYYTPFELINPRRGGSANLLIPVTDTRLDSSYSSKASIAPVFNIDLVLGYELFPQVLPFVEAGVTFARVNENFYSNRSFSNAVTHETIRYTHLLGLNDYVTSYNVGVGVNYIVRHNWFLFSELVYTDLGSQSKNVTLNVPFNGSLSEVYARTERTHIISLFAGFSYLVAGL